MATTNGGHKLSLPLSRKGQTRGKLNRPTEGSLGRTGPATSCDPEIEQRLKSLQRPAACSFVFSMVERYIRSISSRDLTIKSSLPSKESLLELIDTYILMIPIGHSSDEPYHPFTVFEELELLEALRTQIEERMSKDVQLALFDALFGVANDNTLSSDHRLSILQKLVSLAISCSSNGVVLHCAAYWMEIYPAQASNIAQYIYFEFCELLPNAMEPLFQICTSYPTFTKLLTHHLTISYPIHSVTSKCSLSHNSCPPIKLLQLISHWLDANSEFLTSPQLFTESTAMFIRSQAIRTNNVNPLLGLAQWCILESFITDETLIRMKNKTTATSENKFVVEYRTEMSRLHANILSYMLSLSVNSPASVAVLATNDVSLLVANLLDLYRRTSGGSEKDSEEAKEQRMGLSLERLAQLLQIGLSANIITIKPGDLSAMLSNLPQNKLLDIVITHYNNK